MTIRQKLALMEEIENKNRKQYEEYSRLMQKQRFIDFLWDTLDEVKGTLLSVGIGVLLGYIVLWIAGG